MHVQDIGRGNCALDLCVSGYETVGASCGDGNAAPTSKKFWGNYCL